jgi:hypothetical protein
MKYLYPAIQPGFMVYSDEHIFVRMHRECGRFRVDHTDTGPAVFTKLFNTHLAASRYADGLVKASLKDREDPLKYMTARDRKQYSVPSHVRGAK